MFGDKNQRSAVHRCWPVGLLTVAAVAVGALIVFVGRLSPPIIELRNPLPHEIPTDFAAQEPVGSLSLGALMISSSVSQLEPPPMPQSLHGAISVIDESLAVFAPRYGHQTGKGFWYFLSTIPLTGTDDSVTVPILLDPNRQHTYPAKTSGFLSGSGPYFWQGKWLVSFAPNWLRGKPMSTSGPDTNPVYYFNADGGIAKSWLPESIGLGVLGFAAHGDYLYVIPAVDTGLCRTTIKARHVPEGKLLKMTWDGDVISAANLPMNVTLAGEPYLSVDVRVVADRLCVLQRVPAALAMPLTKALGYEDIAPVVDLIAPPRIDIFDLDLNLLNSSELYVSSDTGRYYAMDIDADEGLILLVGFWTGQAWLYDLELNLIKRYSHYMNWGLSGTEDFVLHKRKVYVPSGTSFGPAVYVYELGWPEK